MSVPSHPAWADKVNVKALKADLDALGATLRAGQGAADEAHFEKMLLWQRACFWIGFLTSFFVVNPISVFLISCGINARWTMIGHHVCHGGYDNLKGDHLHRKKYALGWRRIVDWLDWMLPEAWNCEHNQFHHYQLGELSDPDLVERNLRYTREASWPLAVKYFAVLFLMLTWKWFYYAPNTFKELRISQARGTPNYSLWRKFTNPFSLLNPTIGVAMGLYGDLFTQVMAPYFVWSFLVLPAVGGMLGSLLNVGAFAMCAKTTCFTMLLAETLTNLHSFIVIVTNHCGDDVYRFDTNTDPKTGEFYLRQIIGSVNYKTGSDLNDFMHGYLNYQIEHHIWPDLTMLSYKKAQPLVKKVCEKHGIPYNQQSVWRRLKKTVDVMVGVTSMPVFTKSY